MLTTFLFLVVYFLPEAAKNVKMMNDIGITFSFSKAKTVILYNLVYIYCDVFICQIQ